MQNGTCSYIRYHVRTLDHVRILEDARILEHGRIPELIYAEGLLFARP